MLHTHFSPRKNEYILVFPRKDQYILIFSPGKISIYSSFPLIFRGKSEYILKFPPHTQFSPFALIDYTRAITPIRGRPYGDFCRAFDAEEGRSPLFFSICNWIRQWLSVNLFLRISTVYSTPRHNIISFKLNKLFCGSLFVCNRSF